MSAHVISRTCCVYCGVRIKGSDYRSERYATALACPRHLSLVALDPSYTVDKSVEGGETNCATRNS